MKNIYDLVERGTRQSIWTPCKKNIWGWINKGPIRFVKHLAQVVGTLLHLTNGVVSFLVTPCHILHIVSSPFVHDKEYHMKSTFFGVIVWYFNSKSLESGCDLLSVTVNYRSSLAAQAPFYLIINQSFKKVEMMIIIGVVWKTMQFFIKIWSYSFKNSGVLVCLWQFQRWNIHDIQYLITYFVKWLFLHEKNRIGGYKHIKPIEDKVLHKRSLTRANMWVHHEQMNFPWSSRLVMVTNAKKKNFTHVDVCCHTWAVLNLKKMCI